MSVTKKTILVVDDEPDLLKLLEWQLMMAGYDVLTAQNGTEGLKQVQKKKPDLIILDIIMPIRDMNGVQMSELLSQDEATRGIPVIFYTSTVDSEERLENGHVMLSKSASSEKLLNTIKELTGRQNS